MSDKPINVDSALDNNTVDLHIIKSDPKTILFSITTNTYKTPSKEENTEVDNDAENYIFNYTSRKEQIKFEFWYLIWGMIFGIILLLLNSIIPQITSDLRVSIYSFLGGFFGGWVFVTKWFYRVTARGRNNQKKWKWEPHKIYWRILTPFISAIVALALYCISISGIFTLVTIDRTSSHAAFGLSFLLGYFSDILLSKMFDWTTLMWGNGNQKGDKYFG